MKFNISVDSNIILYVLKYNICFIFTGTKEYKRLNILIKADILWILYRLQIQNMLLKYYFEYFVIFIFNR